MIEFLQQNASAIFALLGAVFGSTLTGFFGFISKSKETKLRITEKVIDRKLQAYDNLIDFIGLIRTMVLLGGWVSGRDGQNELKRTPHAMFSHQNFDDLLVEFSSMKNSSERWFSYSVKREMSLFLDYMVTLKELVRRASDQQLQEIGVMLRDDFIEFAVKIEDTAHDFLNKDLLKLDHKTDRKWHKYKPEETIEKLESTRLFRLRETIEIVILQPT